MDEAIVNLGPNFVATEVYFQQQIVTQQLILTIDFNELSDYFFQLRSRCRACALFYTQLGLYANKADLTNKLN